MKIYNYNVNAIYNIGDIIKYQGIYMITVNDYDYVITCNGCYLYKYMKVCTYNYCMSVDRKDNKNIKFELYPLKNIRKDKLNEIFKI